MHDHVTQAKQTGDPARVLRCAIITVLVSSFTYGWISSIVVMIIALPVVTLPQKSANTVHAAAPNAVFADASMSDIALLSVDVPPQRSSAVSHPDPHIGVYLPTTMWSNPTLATFVMDRLSRIAHPSLVLDVKGSSVYFETDSPLAKQLELVHPKGDLAAFIKHAKEQGIYTIARFIAVKDPGLAHGAPETQIRHPRTRISVGASWVDPSHPTVLDYNMQVLEDLIRAGIDEVNFDYIRYPTDYAPVQIGLTPTELADRLEVFLRQARTTIDASGKETKLGISTYAILGWNYQKNLERLGQDVVRFAPLVDIISPMAYPATFAEGSYYRPGKDPVSRMYFLVYRTLMGYRELLGDEHAWKLRPWIQGYGVSRKNVIDEVRAVMDAGSCGFQVWNANGNYEPIYQTMKDWKIPAECGFASL